MEEEVQREGAQIDWKQWGEAHLSDLLIELRMVTTWALRNGEEMWGKHAVVKLENETNWIGYALRE
jgi:hypothetical protein